MVESCERALETPHPRILDPLSALDWVVVDRDDLRAHGSLDSFEGVDTPADVRWATEQLQ
jgi:molybdopterin-guanine dinucleotide biosynthesis protein A